MRLNEKDYENIININLEDFICSLMSQSQSYANAPISKSNIQMALLDQGLEFVDGRIEAALPEMKQIPVVEKNGNDEEIPIDSEKDVAIGEVVEFDGERLVCIEDGSIDGFLEECSGCAFMKNGKCRSIVRSCSKDKRYDGKDVIFKKISF